MKNNILVCEFDGMEKFKDNIQFHQVIHNIQTRTKGELQTLVCVIENGLTGYNYLKFM